jgi:hypothetical protein
VQVQQPVAIPREANEADEVVAAFPNESWWNAVIASDEADTKRTEKKTRMELKKLEKQQTAKKPTKAKGATSASQRWRERCRWCKTLREIANRETMAACSQETHDKMEEADLRGMINQ